MDSSRDSSTPRPRPPVPDQIPDDQLPSLDTIRKKFGPGVDFKLDASTLMLVHDTLQLGPRRYVKQKHQAAQNATNDGSGPAVKRTDADGPPVEKASKSKTDQ